MHMIALPACLCTMCMGGAFTGQKVASDLPELELQTAVSPHVSGNRTWIIY